MRTDYVVFDLGGVVLTPTDALPEIAAILGVSVQDQQSLARFMTAYSAERLDYDRTSDDAAYWASVARHAGADAPSAAMCGRLTAIDIAGWSHTDPAALALIEDLRAAGVGLAILSNMPSTMGETVRAMPWAAAFDHIVISGDLGMVKPELAIYRTLLDTLDVPAERVAFTDDLAVNVDAAAALGIGAVRFTGVSALRDTLRARGVDV